MKSENEKVNKLWLWLTGWLLFGVSGRGHGERRVEEESLWRKDEEYQNRREEWKEGKRASKVSEDGEKTDEVKKENSKIANLEIEDRRGKKKR